MGPRFDLTPADLRVAADAAERWPVDPDWLCDLEWSSRNGDP